MENNATNQNTQLITTGSKQNADADPIGKQNRLLEITSASKCKIKFLFLSSFQGLLRSTIQLTATNDRGGMIKKRNVFRDQKVLEDRINVDQYEN